MATTEQLREINRATRFSSENQPNHRKRINRFKHLQGQYELNKRDVETIVEYLMSISLSELTEVFKNDETPVVMKAYASAIMQAIKKGDMTQLDKILDRRIGKVPNTVLMDGSVELTTNEKDLKENLIKKLKTKESNES